MLFALLLEPLDQLIRQENICSISVKSYKQHISLYADGQYCLFRIYKLHSPDTEVFESSVFFPGIKSMDKSSLLPLNCMAKKVRLPCNVPIQTSLVT